jgi:hypothetical protein
MRAGGSRSVGGTINQVKSVDLFETVIPTLSRLAILENTTGLCRAACVSMAAQAAQKLGIQVLELDIRGVAADVDGAFQTAME